MSEISVADEVEHYLQSLHTVVPQERECLVCFLLRMLTEFGCDASFTWARRFRDLRSPTATALEKRFGQRLVLCDCLIVHKAHRPVRELMVRDLRTDELERPERMPPCSGVRRTSTRACANWERGGAEPPA